MSKIETHSSVAEHMFYMQKALVQSLTSLGSAGRETLESL